MNKEKLEEALKVVKEPITVNSIEYKYFDIENYNKLVNAIDYCNYLNANVKPYVEAQDKEIERLTAESTEWESKYYKYQDIIDELEKVLNEEVMLRYHGNDNAKENKIFNAGGMLYRDYIIDKLKELKNK